ncbi:hypothetical protein M1O19_05515 [Dehalococcoidia bacterium]|nr:hypothetical protein [Dehalococcoidia bacterium]
MSGVLNLEKIATNGRELMEREYTYGAAVEGYKKILSELSKEECQNV